MDQKKSLNIVLSVHMTVLELKAFIPWEFNGLKKVEPIFQHTFLQGRVVVEGERNDGRLALK